MVSASEKYNQRIENVILSIWDARKWHFPLLPLPALERTPFRNKYNRFVAIPSLMFCLFIYRGQDGWYISHFQSRLYTARQLNWASMIHWHPKTRLMHHGDWATSFWICGGSKRATYLKLAFKCRIETRRNSFVVKLIPRTCDPKQRNEPVHCKERTQFTKANNSWALQLPLYWFQTKLIWEFLCFHPFYPFFHSTWEIAEKHVLSTGFLITFDDSKSNLEIEKVIFAGWW